MRDETPMIVEGFALNSSDVRELEHFRPKWRILDSWRSGGIGCLAGR